jgi:hypothetical protein
LDELTSYQLAEWEAYDELDPIGEWRDDFRIASLSSLISNIVLALYQDPEEKKQGKVPEYTEPLEFMPEFDPVKISEAKEKPAKKEKKHTPEQIKWLFQQMAIVSKGNKPVKFKGKDRTRKRKSKQ